MAGERRLNFRYVLSPEGLLRDRALRLNAQGTILAIEEGSAPWDGTLALPGMPNAHSHVFQRALAGRGEERRGADSFWSWREAMYRLANRLQPESLYDIARQAYGEMLAAGFTAVAEFHYLHHRRDGARGAEMAEAVLAAARGSGIRLRLLPVLYQRGNFDRGPEPAQRRFVHERLEDFLALLETLAPRHPGLAFHSLRAVDAALLAPALAQARRMLGAEIPVHIHLAEQEREVADCRAATGKSPVELLLETGVVDSHWALVHATRATDGELAALAATGATVVICPLTEASLGDGIFPGAAFLDAGGRIAVGSDANSRIDAVEELRWLEYGQRLASRARARLADASGLGAPLWSRLAAGGAAALALPLGAIAPGRMADLVVLDPGFESLLGHDPESWADALVVAGDRGALARVYVAGESVVDHGEWAGRAEIGRRYDATLRSLAGMM
ncbi:MAG TPA: formimidoylglutamate deiminase [Gammaproteobacteria bacterium]|nr:formimidoylglutamate deiminase [Gammaproteobacteria bacterium]